MFLADDEDISYLPPELEKQRSEKAEARVRKLLKRFQRKEEGEGDGVDKVDLLDIPCVVRALGFNPTEEQLVQVIEGVEEDASVGYVTFTRLVPFLRDMVVTNELAGKVLTRDSEDQIYNALTTLSPEGKQEISKEELIRMMTTMGDPFTQEEMNEFLDNAIDPNTGMMNIDDYAHLLAADEGE